MMNQDQSRTKGGLDILGPRLWNTSRIPSIKEEEDYVDLLSGSVGISTLNYLGVKIIAELGNNASRPQTRPDPTWRVGCG